MSVEILSGNHQLVMPMLLAHEFGHLLGATHDGEPARSVVVVDTPVGVIMTMSFLCRHRHSIYYNVPRVPCPDGKFLLSPVVRHYMRTWSDCTRKMIDAEFKRREDKGENCFFT